MKNKNNIIKNNYMRNSYKLIIFLYKKDKLK